MSMLAILTGFLLLFALYQLAEASAQNVLHLPGKPYTFFLLFMLVIPAADLVARWQREHGLAAYGMDLHGGWWRNYLLGLAMGVSVNATFEFLGVRLGIRRVSNLRISVHNIIVGIVWILVTNFPAAAAEDLITRGYVWRFMQQSPLEIFLLVSALLYTLNHIIRLLTRPVTDWYHLPFLGLTLAYALYQTGSLWFVIGLHQSGNVVYSLMQGMMDIANTTDTGKRIAFGILSELILWLVVILAMPLAQPA